jgi:multidrug efflux pump subunit AcrA (membrane-fusion protein)
MNIHFKKIFHYFSEIGKQLVFWYRELSKRNKIIYTTAFFAGIALCLFFVFRGSKETEKTSEQIRSVKIASVSDLSDSQKEFPLVGVVTSVSEATLRSESSGRLTRVYKKLGDYVSAGAVIAEFDNSGERASLLQAEGAYEQAKAARGIATLTSKQAGYSLTDSKTSALNALTGAYSQMDDAIRGKTDIAYSSPKFITIKFLLSVPDANLIGTLEAKRKALEDMLVAREIKNSKLTTSDDLALEITLAQNEAQMVKVYLDDLFTAYSKALPDAAFSQSALDAGKANVQAGRQSISGVLSSLSSARSGLTSSVTANQVAGGEGSAVSGTLATADAQVKQSLGLYNAALSRLEKTIIRSPISGTLNSLTISTGDYVGAFTQVAVVSNNGALEVLSLVTDDDAKRISIGSPVLIDGKAHGVVTRIASAIDPTTKKIEVRIGITDNGTSLVNGQSVRVSISKNIKTVAVKSGPTVIPLSSLKLTPRGANVFTVNASSTLVALPVKEGAILGEQIQILEGLTGSEVIVVDARGLKEGMTVTVGN